MKKIFWGGLVATTAAMIPLYVGHTPPFSDLFQDATARSVWLGLILILAIGWLLALLYRIFFREFLLFLPPYWLRGVVYGILIGILSFIVSVMFDADLVTDRITTEILSMLLAGGVYGLVLGVWMGGEDSEAQAP